VFAVLLGGQRGGAMGPLPVPGAAGREVLPRRQGRRGPEQPLDGPEAPLTSATRAPSRLPSFPFLPGAAAAGSRKERDIFC